MALLWTSLLEHLILVFQFLFFLMTMRVHLVLGSCILCLQCKWGFQLPVSFVSGILQDTLSSINMLEIFDVSTKFVCVKNKI